MMAVGSLQPRPGVTAYQQPEGAPRFLSDIIIELGLAEQQHVDSAVDTARSSGETVGRVLVREGRLSEDQLARALAARYGLNHVDLEEFEVDAQAANLLPPAAAKRYRAVPVSFEPGGGLLVAMADPSDSLAISDIAFMTKLDVRAAVAAENLIAALVERLPLTPSASSYVPEPAAPVAPPPPPPEPVAPPPSPAVDDAELASLRSELERSAAALDEARGRHEREVEELRSQIGGGELRAQLDGALAELDATRADRDGARAELEEARAELQGARDEAVGARADADALRGELEGSRSELDGRRAELDAARGELDARNGELASLRAELEAALAANERAGAHELEEAERRVSDAHATVEKMCKDFEIEREQHAATERDLRARLASQTERHEALQEAHDALQKRVDALRAQNAALLDAYATAKRWSAEFARGARELAATLEQPVLDDAVRAQQAPPDDPRREGPGRFSRDDDEQQGGGGATPPPDWLS